MPNGTIYANAIAVRKKLSEAQVCAEDQQTLEGARKQNGTAKIDFPR